MFSALLVANRGEIACRVIRACKSLKIESVAVFSDVDAGAVHAAVADKSQNIGGANPADSYLNAERLIEVARDYGADAIHPGYGFLSENAEFAERCERAGIAFVGPSAAIIRMMGDKIAARQVAKDAGAPIVPGMDKVTDFETARQVAAAEVGYPLLVKASGGGGGIGIVAVNNESELEEALKLARQVGKSAFANADVYIEKLLTDVAHIEVQILGDKHGNAIHLFERNCSVQRRNQKLIEETPAVFLSAAQCDDICAAAVRLASHVGYDSAGTVEFLFDRIEQKFYFIEMNTRIQVEHPITEMIVGVDLVQNQIRVAAGEKLPDIGLTQSAVKRQGCAIEARVLAEDSSTQTPSPGAITSYAEPSGVRDLRVDSGIGVNSEITTHYDSLLAKLIAWGEDRETARRRLARALRLFKIGGVSTNITLLLSLIESDLFKSGDYNTRILQLALERSQGETAFSSADIAALAVMLHFERQKPPTIAQTNGAPTAEPSAWWRAGHRRLLSGGRAARRR